MPDDFDYTDHEGRSCTYMPSENGTAAQRNRLLKALQLNSINTIEAREYLGIMHPAGRIKELRDLGFNIQSVPTVIERDGVASTIATYHLRPYHDAKD
ncbi:MAG: helix-turn-helix domain-containing protein [Hyphomicrobiales bacterium]